MKKVLITILALFLLVGCQGYDQQQITQPTGPVPAPQPPAPLPAKVIPTIQILDTPDVLLSGQPARFTWQVEGGQMIEHTNIHTSFTSDFAERVDTEKQSGTSGEFSDTLTLESDKTQTVYIRAHANIDGADYRSDVVTRELQVADMQGSPSSVTADIADFSFQPQTINIKSGDTVVWTQQDGAPHTVTAVSGPESFDSGTMGKGQTFSHTFNTPGTYEYKCSIHSSMEGTVVVS